MVSYDISKVWLFLPTLVQALPATLALMVLTTLLGSAFGLVLTWAQVSEEKVGAGLAKGHPKRSNGSGLEYRLDTSPNHLAHCPSPSLSRGSSQYDDCHLEPHARCRFGLYHWLYRYYGSRKQLDQSQSWKLFPRDVYSRSSDLLGNCPCDLLLRSTP